MELLKVKLEALPEEIIDNIARQIPANTSNLRLTCKTLEEKVHHAFLTDVVSERVLWVNRASIQSLEDIANSDRLGPHVRKIIIMNYEWDIEEAEGLWGDGEGLDADELQPFNYFYKQQPDQTYILQSGSLAMSLARILPRLPKLETILMFPPELPWPTLEWATPIRYTWLERLALGSTPTEEFIISLWFNICQAMLASKWKPKMLHLGMDDENQLPGECFSSLVKPQRALLAPTFEHLDVLSLGIHVPSDEPQHNLWLVAFTEFLKLCKSVSGLSLRFVDDSDDYDGLDHMEPLLSNMSDWPTFHTLDMLELCWIRCHYLQLLEFLQKHRTSLKKLYLADVVFAEQDHWRLFLEGVGENTDLDEADITMYEARHGAIRMIEAKRPLIQQAIEDRVRDGIFCQRCAGGHHESDSDDLDGSLDSDGAEIDSELHSLVDEGEDEEWEDE